jgi:hypothetical protein
MKTQKLTDQQKLNQSAGWLVHMSNEKRHWKIRQAAWEILVVVFCVLCLFCIILAIYCLAP